MQDLVRKGEAVVHIVPTTANYLRFLAILVSGAYAPVVLMPRRIRQYSIEYINTNSTCSYVEAYSNELELQKAFY